MPAAEVQTTSLILNVLGDLGASSFPWFDSICLYKLSLAGKTLFVPSIASSDGSMDFVRVYTEEDYRSFPSGLWGIPEPTPEWSSKKRQSGATNLRAKSSCKLIITQVFDADCDNLDLILVPGGYYACINTIHGDHPLSLQALPLTDRSHGSGMERATMIDSYHHILPLLGDRSLY
jgi:hypothetical protein